MERVTICAQTRQKTGKGAARQLRVQGDIPAILYGQQKEPRLLLVNRKELTQKTSSRSGLHAIFDLWIDQQEKVPVILKEYQADVISRCFLHADFLQIDLTKKISVEVPIHLVGKAAGTKEGGILEQIMRELKVVCLPTAIPQTIEVDVSALQVGDSIHVRDLTLPAGIEWSSALADETVAAVVAPVEEKLEAVPSEVVQPEVTGQKKASEEAAKPAAGKEGKKEEKKK